MRVLHLAGVAAARKEHRHLPYLSRGATRATPEVQSWRDAAYGGLPVNGIIQFAPRDSQRLLAMFPPIIVISKGAPIAGG